MHRFKRSISRISLTALFCSFDFSHHVFSNWYLSSVTFFLIDNKPMMLIWSRIIQTPLKWQCINSKGIIVEFFVKEYWIINRMSPRELNWIFFKCLGHGLQVLYFRICMWIFKTPLSFCILIFVNLRTCSFCVALYLDILALFYFRFLRRP